MRESPTGTPTFNHVAMSVPVDLLEPSGRRELLDFYGEYRFKTRAPGLKVFVDAKNILDQDYTEVYGYATMGFNVTGGLSLTF